jgi:hypothetical protein
MGRPLPKRFFGNRNLGSSSTTADEGIGGSRVASVTISTPGSYAGGSSPTVSFSAPDLAGVGAVTAAGSVVMEALSATAATAGNGYNIGDILTVTYGGQTATFTVATLTAGPGSGVATVTPLDRGSFTETTLGYKATTNDGTGDDNCTLTILYRVKSITMTEKGSGYTNVADAAPTFSAGAAAGTSVLETDGTGIYEYGTNENAITISAYLPTTAATGLISGAGGAAAKNGDIQAQHGTRRYIVETADGVGIVKLVAAAPAAGEATIVATDSDSNEYYVTKLTRHRATLTQKTLVGGSYQFDTNESAPWTFDSAVSGESVKVANT